MTSFLVLGAGQVGTFVARALEETGASVAAADMDPAPGFFARFGPRSPVELFQADVTNRQELATIIARLEVQVIVLCAGLVGQQCDRQPDLAWRLNVEGARTVATVALDTEIRRLVYVSSLAIYGGSVGSLVRESQQPRPRSLYGQTKAAAEDAVAQARSRGLDVRVLRPCGTYGPIRLGRGSRSSQLIEAALTRVIDGRDCEIESVAGSGDELLYVKDLGRAVALAATVDISSESSIFNVGIGHWTTAEDLRAALLEVAPDSVVRIRWVGAGGHDPIPPLDVSLIREALGFTPRFSLPAGLRDYSREASLA